VNPPECIVVTVAMLEAMGIEEYQPTPGELDHIAEAVARDIDELVFQDLHKEQEQ
jgi:hypothetical protein